LLQKQQTVAEWCGAGMVVCLEQGADLHMAQLMPLPLTVSCFTKIQIGFSFLVLAHLGSPGKRAVKWVCVCVCECCCRSSNLWKSETGKNVFGGQIIGQALVAAGKTVATHLHVHSMHCYFLLKGNFCQRAFLFLVIF